MSSVELLVTLTLSSAKGNGLVSVQCAAISLWISETAAPESMSMDECLLPNVPCSTNGLYSLTLGGHKPIHPEAHLGCCERNDGHSSNQIKLRLLV